MKYVVIRTGGKQYKVSEGDTVEVDKLAIASDQEVIFKDVLLWVSDGKIKIGTPIIPKIKVKARILEQKKGKKIRVTKFKAKVNYRRAIGFRPLLTRVKIEKIDLL